jgi:hypothetical protein
VSPLGDHGKKGIKGNHPGDLTEGDIQAVGDLPLYPTGQVAEKGLSFMEDQDQSPWFSSIFGDELSKFFVMLFFRRLRRSCLNRLRRHPLSSLALFQFT